MRGAALDRHAFKDVVVDLLELGASSDGLARLRIPDHDVGIGAGGDTALARVDIENLGGIGRGHGHELIHGQAARAHAMMPKHFHAVFNTAGAVWNQAEIVFAHGFLLGAETAVIGGRGLQVARLQTPPQRVLVFFRPERRTHHVSRGGVEILVAIHGIIDQQVPGQHFTKHPLAFVAGAGDGLQRLYTGVVHDVERHIQHLGDANRPVGGFTLHLRRARQRVRFRPCHALLEQLLLQAKDQLAVLRMHRHHGTEFDGP